MPSVLVTPPALEPVSLAEAKAHLRVSHSDEDQIIGALVASARRIVEARSGLMLISQTWVHSLDRWPDYGVIEIPLAPVLAVEELAVYGEDDTKAVIDAAHFPARFLGRDTARDRGGVSGKAAECPWPG